MTNSSCRCSNLCFSTIRLKVCMVWSCVDSILCSRRINSFSLILTIRGCPSCASVRTQDLNLLGITILVPRRISLQITHSSLATGMYCLSWSFLQVPLIIQLRNSLNSSSSADASSISCVVIDPGVEVTATNRTNTSDTLCATVESTWFKRKQALS